MRKFILCTLAVLAAQPALALATSAYANESASALAQANSCTDCEAGVKAVLSHSRRAGDQSRDIFRHPAETLGFFRVRPGMTVVDYMPSGGWYTRVLVPYLGEKGSYIALNPAPGSNPQFAAYIGGQADKFTAAAATWDLQGAPISNYRTNALPASLDGTVDRVLLFRAVHTMKRNSIVEPELRAAHRLLKADGLLGIEQHRAREDAPDGYVDGNKGYLRQKDVIALVQQHGFELIGTSEINANPKDTADHPAGVWELSPNLRTKREELRAVGESDRMTLLFRKRS